MTTETWAGKNVVVTGGIGLLGSHFVEELLARGAAVSCLYRRDNRRVLPQLGESDRLRAVRVDLLDEAALAEVLDSVKPHVDMIIHCAVVSGPMPVRLNQPAHILDANMRVASNILNAARRLDITNLVLLSSSDIYLTASEQPIREEDDFTQQMRYSPDGYYLSKNFAEILAEAFRTEYGMNIYLPRLTSVYGPRDNFEPDTDRVVPSMFAKVVAGEPIEIWGDGSQTRTYMFVTDLVRAVLQMVEKGKYHTLNVGTSETVSVLQLAKLVCAALGEPERIRIDESKSGGRPSRTLDVSRLHEIIDFTPRPLVEGLRETVAWYRNRPRPTAG
ncbi:SDR family NAD(P)-dependent oxidoreductase [Natronosporangium hydrolyticum]|uniref:SDR family NAD(P)-dependent oxidoreductase n=1 Tax=Natronosporangium hydrolyticum TaxID=2811111 RepID=A0A895YJ18_9ACTN|nr:SDR family NAD(P)-dependent oxidoreductase [Natronosporangium hydrolyticum]QSB16032.1 SDR family NAD(P)-dependent oxidoreductase [Natronosporangium hydrolyticum]